MHLRKGPLLEDELRGLQRLVVGPGFEVELDLDDMKEVPLKSIHLGGVMQVMLQLLDLLKRPVGVISIIEVDLVFVNQSSVCLVKCRS